MAKAFEQKIALGIDFAEFDKQLKTVSDRLESAARKIRMPHVDVGGGGGAASAVASAGVATSVSAAGAGGAMDPGAMPAAFGGLGSNVSAGMQAAGAQMTASVARIEKMLDKLASTTITMFRRIDSSMKFPGTERAINAIQARFRQAAEGSGAGVFGKMDRGLASFAARATGAVVPLMKVHSFLADFGDVAGKSFSQATKEAGAFKGALGGVGAAIKSVGATAANIATLGGFGAATRAARGFGQAVKAADGPVASLSGTVKGLGVQIAAAFGIAGVIFKTVQFLKDGVVAASDLAESVDRAKMTFGSAFGDIEAQASRVSRAFGVSKRAQIDMASSFGAMAQGAGMGEEASARLANHLTKVAADLSSSVNMPFEEAGEKIRSALAGQSEPLIAYGANVAELNVKNYALANGIATSSKALTDQQKIIARAGIVMDGLGYAQDNLEITAGSAANQFRKAGGGVAEFGLRLGELLMPAVQAGTGAFNELMASVLELTESSGPTISGWVDTAVAGIGNVAHVVRNLGSYWKLAGLVVQETVANMIARFDTLAPNVGRITEWLKGNWRSLLTDWMNGLKAFYSNLFTNVVSIGKTIWDALQGKEVQFEWTPLLEGFKATTEKFPEMIQPALVDMSEEYAKIFQGIHANEDARSKSLAAMGSGAAGPQKPAPLGEAEKDREYRLASAVEIGSKEAYSIIAKSQANAARDPSREVVNVGKQGNAILRDMRDLMKGGAKPALQVR